jgi:GAF domain-containing protein
MSDFISKYFSNPLILGLAAALIVLVLLIVGFVFLKSRRRKNDEEANVRAELVAMERESQFATASELIQYQAAPEVVATQIAAVFKDYLSLPVFKIYAGHESDADFSNILPRDKNDAIVTNDLSITSALPASILASAALGFSRPQTINTNALMSQQQEGTGQSITAVPWRGAFGWSGLIICNAMQTNPSDALARYQENLVKLGNKLAVALELASEQADRFEAEERVARADNFYQTVLHSLEDEDALAITMREIASLVEADSSALWRLDAASQMLKLEASFGLRSTEFLPLPLGQGLAGNVVETGHPLALEDAASDPRCIFPREARESGIGSYLGVPVIADGLTLGALEVHTVNAKWWSDKDAATLVSAASTIAATIKSSAVRSSKLRVENAYLGLAEALQRLHTPEELKAAVVEVLGHALGVSRAAIIDFDRATAPFSIQHEFISENTKSAVGATFKGTSLKEIIETASGGEPVAIQDSSTQSLIGKELAKQLDILSELAIPVQYDGKTRSMIYLHQCDRVRTWHPAEIEFADRVGRQLSLSLTNVYALNAAKQSAEAARDAAKSAFDSMTRAQTIISTLPEAVFGLDKEGHLTFFNNAAKNSFGLKQEDLGQMANWVDALAMTDIKFWIRVTSSKQVCRFDAKLKQLTPGEQTLSESLIMDDDGGRPVSVSVAPLRVSTGEVNGFLVVLSDRSGASTTNGDMYAQLNSLKEQQLEIERKIAEARATELHARARIEKLNSLEASLRGGEAAKNMESALQQEREHWQLEQMNLRNQMQQLRDTNQLKSEFIVNCGSEMQASVTSTIGLAEMLEQGLYGDLNEQQRATIREIVNKAERIKSDISSLVEYGASRSK